MSLALQQNFCLPRKEIIIRNIFPGMMNIHLYLPTFQEISCFFLLSWEISCYFLLFLLEMEALMRPLKFPNQNNQNFKPLVGKNKHNINSDWLWFTGEYPSLGRVYYFLEKQHAGYFPCLLASFADWLGKHAACCSNTPSHWMNIHLYFLVSELILCSFPKNVQCC